MSEEKYNKEGLLYMQAGTLWMKSWKPRYVRIKGDRCCVLKDSNADGKVDMELKPSDFVSVDAIEEYRDLSFQMRLRSKTLVMRGSEDEDPQEWVKVFLLWRKHFTKK